MRVRAAHGLVTRGPPSNKTDYLIRCGRKLLLIRVKKETLSPLEEKKRGVK